jgi:beta-glucanase (GH16 family)
MKEVDSMSTARKFRTGVAASAAMMLVAGLASTASHATTVPGQGTAPQTATTPRLKLLWHEEYNGAKGIPHSVQTSLQNEKGWHNWTTEVTGSPNNKERQYYTDGIVEYNANGTVAHRAIELDGAGHLAINAVRPQVKTPKHPSTSPKDFCVYGRCEYLSGRMNTAGKLGFKYGQIEANIKIPSGEGTWPAFWMLGANIDQGVSWPGCGEIDIMEASASNRPSSMFGSLHSYPDDGFGVTSSAYPDNFYTKYHRYGIRWTFNKIEFMVDGEVYNTITKADVTSEQIYVEDQGNVAREYPFNKEFFLILNLAMGGTLGGDQDGQVTRDANNKLPAGGTMLVDYIRYYSVNGQGKLIRH